MFKDAYCKYCGIKLKTTFIDSSCDCSHKNPRPKPMYCSFCGREQEKHWGIYH